MVDRPERVAAGMSAEDYTPRDVLIEAAIAEVDLHLPAELHIADRTDLEARELRPGRFAFATAGSLFYVASGVTWQVRTQDPERAAVTAYQDGVWLGRAIVPVDAIAPGEAPPEWNEVVRFVGSCVVRVAAGTRRWGRRGRARRRKPALEVCTFDPLRLGLPSFRPTSPVLAPERMLVGP